MLKNHTACSKFLSRSHIKGAGILAAFVLAAFLILAASDAFALRVTLKRIEFEGPKRTEILTIVNNTAEEQVYRLGWRPMRMTEGASLEFIEGDTPDNPVEDMVKFAPRRIVLPAGASQQVRLLLRRPRDLAVGEYRSHLWFQPEEEAVEFQPVESSGDKPTIQLKMLTGLTLPVFVRAGNLTAEVAISNLKATRSGNKVDVSFNLERKGERSVYGDFQFICDGSIAKEIRGIAVYTEISRRLMNFNINLTEKNISSCNQLTVKYTAPEEDTLFKGDLMAEASTRL